MPKVKVDLDDVSLMDDDIQKVSIILENNLNGELTEDEEHIMVDGSQIHELKNLLLSAASIIQGYEYEH